MRAGQHLNRIPQPAHCLADLTGAQQEIARLVAEGLSNDEIADRIYRSNMTVRNQLKDIYGRFGWTGERGQRVRLARLVWQAELERTA